MGRGAEPAAKVGGGGGGLRRLAGGNVLGEALWPGVGDPTVSLPLPGLLMLRGPHLPLFLLHMLFTGISPSPTPPTPAQWIVPASARRVPVSCMCPMSAECHPHSVATLLQGSRAGCCLGC